MTEAGNEAPMFRAEHVQTRRHGRAQIHAAGMAAVDIAQQLHALLAGAAMHVAQRVDAARDGAVDADAAGDRHARDGNGGRLRPVIDAGDKHRAEQIGLALGGKLAPQHKPDHRGKADPSDQFLDCVTANADRSRRNIRDLALPPIRHGFERKTACLFLVVHHRPFENLRAPKLSRGLEIARPHEMPAHALR